eukprot:TRINITY_DN613_c0_g1_i2.p1 TRINITY_DN613_c0_g1~~TRINITY_DN613_c0_g1_i2.p1  ORF type:complete len:562 (+),score=177.33 TRINITY_DN613_c0_g1_i2:32-1717(+)
MAAATDIENAAMYCFQCEQTFKGVACTGPRGVCLKEPNVAGLQDHLIHGLQALSAVAVRVAGPRPEGQDEFVAKATFATLTNVNFSPEDLAVMIRECYERKNRLVKHAGAAALDGVPADLLAWKPGTDIATMCEQARAFLISRRFAKLGQDRVCLQELLVYGLKGACAYLHHAMELGRKSEEASVFILQAFAFVQKADPTVPELLSMCLDCGRHNLEIMKLLDEAHTTTFGHPEPTKVHWAKNETSALPGKAILVSGHDLPDLEALLKQTEGKGINVWTHGEMLPCLAYPGLKKYKHLAGHYGTAWQNQRKEFAAFPGPILMTTNCYIPAPDSYLSRVFCCAPTGGVGVKLANRKDFSELIKAAHAAPGFPAPTTEPASLTIGFARNTVLGVADKVVAAAKSGALRRIFLIGGCDGFAKERNYYTEFAEKVPNDCLILTLACGKFKINSHDYGTLGGLPRLLDMGQCNDSYSAVAVAVALVGALNLSDVNELPLSIVLSWFEQKAVVVLLSLLSLGIRRIYVGPRLPAFFTPAILKVLGDKFDLRPLGTPEADLATMLAGK